MASNPYAELTPDQSIWTMQARSNENHQNSSSPGSSIVIANIETLKNNLNEMVNNLSEMGTFLDNDQVNLKQRSACIQHPTDVCDASKSDEMKLNEILDLLHQLTKTLTAYEKSPLLAEHPCWSDVNLNIKTKQLETSSQSSNQAEKETTQGCLIETKSLRNEIDGIIQRKEALEERMESFRKASTAVAAECDSKSPVPFSGGTPPSSGFTPRRSYGGLADLKKEDELLGWSDDGGLSGEINSLGQTIQHLLDENRNFRLFFDTILAKNKSDLSTDGVDKSIRDNPTSLMKESQSFKESPTDLNYINYGNDTSPPLRLATQEKCQEELPYHCFPTGSVNEEIPCAVDQGASNNNPSVFHLERSNRDQLCSVINNCDSENTNPLHTTDSKRISAETTYTNRNSYGRGDPQIETVRECNSKPFTKRSLKNLSPLSESNGEILFPDRLNQLCELECKLNRLSTEAQSFNEMLQMEKCHMASDDYTGNFKSANKNRFSRMASQLSDASSEIYVNVSQLFRTKSRPCHSDVCHHEIERLRKENKLLQKQLSLQMGLTALIASPSSKTSLVTDSQHVADSNCPILSPNSAHLTSNSLSQSEGCVVKSNLANGSVCHSQTANTDQCSPQMTNECENEKMNELHKLLVEAQLRGQLWFAAEKATAIRLADVEERLRKAKQSKRELQIKYKSIRQTEARKCLPVNYKKASLLSQPIKSYEIMLTTLGRNIGIAADIISSHLYFSKCGIHPAPELVDDPTFWFAAQCSRLRWLQAELRQLCIDNWKNTAPTAECAGSEASDTLTRKNKESSRGGHRSHEWPAAAVRSRRLSLPECGRGPTGVLFPCGSWSHLNNSKHSLPAGGNVLLGNEEMLNFFQQLTQLPSETNVDSVESQFCNGTSEGISELSASSKLTSVERS